MYHNEDLVRALMGRRGQLARGGMGYEEQIPVMAEMPQADNSIPSSGAMIPTPEITGLDNGPNSPIGMLLRSMEGNQPQDPSLNFMPRDMQLAPAPERRQQIHEYLPMWLQEYMGYGR